MNLCLLPTISKSPDFLPAINLSVPANFTSLFLQRVKFFCFSPVCISRCCPLLCWGKWVDKIYLSIAGSMPGFSESTEEIYIITTIFYICLICFFYTPSMEFWALYIVLPSFFNPHNKPLRNSSLAKVITLWGLWLKMSWIRCFPPRGHLSECIVVSEALSQPVVPNGANGQGWMGTEVHELLEDPRWRTTCLNTLGAILRWMEPQK